KHVTLIRRQLHLAAYVLTRVLNRPKPASGLAPGALAICGCLRINVTMFNAPLRLLLPTTRFHVGHRLGHGWNRIPPGQAGRNRVPSTALRIDGAFDSNLPNLVEVCW